MKRVYSLLIGLLMSILLGIAEAYPVVNFENLTPQEISVFYGEKKAILIKMTHTYLRHFQEWRLPIGVQLLGASGVCPPMGNGALNLPFIGVCYLSFLINGYQLGQVINGAKIYRLYGYESKLGPWNYWGSIPFSITVIPHPFSMIEIPRLQATAALPFFADLKAYVHYYAENIQAGIIPYLTVLPHEQNGLVFDPNLVALRGTPTRPGIFAFKVGFMNAELKDLLVEIGINPNNRPRFKSVASLPTAVPGGNYQFNLLELVNSDVQPSNPILFRFDANESHPEWLEIRNGVLCGTVPQEEAGQERQVTLIASSNTGGDSKSLALKLPIAVNSKNKPRLLSFSLKKTVTQEIFYDIRPHIVDPTHDENPRLILDKVEPEAPWLYVSQRQPTVLKGLVPLGSQGQEYSLSLHLRTTKGGDSDPRTISLTIAEDKEKTPRFKMAGPQLPIAYAGQFFYYDFVQNRDVYPEFEDLPYQISLADQKSNPPWIKIEDNKLIADQVPNLDDSLVTIFLRIHNGPGGWSATIPVSLVVVSA